MSKDYKQITLKYRPRVIEEVIGNAEAKSQAASIIKKKDTHAILIHGPSGCVDAETEFLTPTGWKSICSYQQGDSVAQYNKNSGYIEFIQPLEYIKLPAKYLYHFKHDYGIDMMLCKDHRVLWSSNKTQDHAFASRNKYNISTVKELLDKDNLVEIKIPVTFETGYTSNKLTLTNIELRLQVALMADGHIPKDRDKVTVSLKKSYKIKRLRILLDKSGYSYKEWFVGGYTRFSFVPPIRTKVFDERFWLASKEQLKIIAEEALLWDGNRVNIFNTTVKSSADFIQYAFLSQGMAARVLKRKSYLWGVHVTNRKYIGLGTTKPSRVESLDGFKYCFRVETGFLVLRRNGSVFVTGNCSKTTLARIIANGLTKFPSDITEENVSDKRGIGDVRDFIKASQYLPQGAFRIFILDEIHALMGQAQSAILKTIEEPVHDQVVWIVCTDRPHQLDVPLLNRLYKIRVEKPTQAELAKLLYKVSRKEKFFTFEEEKLKRICLEVAKVSDRVPREALQIIKEIADKQENFENFKDLVINGIRKVTENNIDKIALQVIMCIYSSQKSIESKVQHLFSILEDKDVWALTLRLVDVHHHLLKFGAGVKGGPGFYFAKELKDTDSVPPLQLGIKIASKLVDIRNGLHTINTGLHNYVIPKIAELVIEADRGKK